MRLTQHIAWREGSGGCSTGKKGGGGLLWGAGVGVGESLGVQNNRGEWKGAVGERYGWLRQHVGKRER